MKENITIGAHILESLTTGMYQDSRTIFREYIQNSCDAIDEAVKAGVIAEGEGEIRIELDAECRNITIEDNGTGISAKDFVRVVGNVADSDKIQGESRGFRGIGRLCGLAYCGTLVFTAKYRGEGVVSRLRCSAEVLRQLLGERDSGIKRYTASEVLKFVNEFEAEETEDVDGHFFRVELIHINDENTELLDEARVREYLSFVAPLPYHVGFAEYRSKIHGHAKGLGQRIDEYDIFLNGDQLFKDYTRTIPTSKGSDEVFDLEFHDFLNSDGKISAWIWVGISRLKAQIKAKDCPMWGIRLRKGNIQVGNEYTMSRFFEEDRGNRYFIGEIFCVSDELIPNSRRDYFVENKALIDFAEQVKEYCEELSDLYRAGSKLNSSYEKFKKADGRIIELEYRLHKKYFLDDASREQLEAELKEAREEAAKHKADFERAEAMNENTRKIAGQIKSHIRNSTDGGGGHGHNTKKYSKHELSILQKVFGIISDELGKTADSVILRIKEGLGLE